MGNKCTRKCKFCAINKANKNEFIPLDTKEPDNIALAVKKLNLNYVVLTSVTRDDLDDGGAYHYYLTIEKIKKLKPNCKIEVLIPDFNFNIKSLELIALAKPFIINHNMETVKRLYPIVRPQANYYNSLKIIEYFSKLDFITKSGIMIGLGEGFEEIIELMKDLINAGCRILTIGQYLQPNKNLLPVEKYYTPEEFDELRSIGENLGFEKVFSGPLVRSSFHADVLGNL